MADDRGGGWRGGRRVEINLDGLPDLDQQLRQFLLPLRVLFSILLRGRLPLPRSKSSPSPDADWQSAAGTASPLPPPAEKPPAAARRVDAPAHVAPKPAAAAPKRALRADLRDVDFLRRAIVVNEILDKPLALRRRR